MKFSISVALSVLPFLAPALPTLDARAAVGASVVTTSGTYVGHAAPGFPHLSEYLNIQYGQSTAGSNRFMPPVAFRSNEVFQAAEFGPACPYSPAPEVPEFPDQLPPFQHIYDTFEGTGSEVKLMSEDCLSINVWTANPSPAAGLPVLVFIYGGRFASGTANSTFYVGQNVASSGEVVYVSFNYRLSAFGFPGAPGITQNLGLLDQRLALEWVRENIAQFGGDPDQITIAGQSVGGLSVDYHTYAFPKDPIARAAMSISGTAASTVAVSAEIMEENWFTLTGALGCPTTGNAVPCMQSQTFSAILAAVAKVPDLKSLALLAPAFQETVDEVVVFSDYATRGQNGLFAPIPYLLGNLDNEAGFYKILGVATKINLTEDQFDDFNLQAFTCAAAIEAENRVNNCVTVYRYRGFMDFEGLRMYPTAGAYHGSDLNFWFGNAPFQAQAPSTAIEQATINYMMSALIAFVRDPEDGLANFGWPRYSTDGSATLVQLGFNNETTASFVPPLTFDGPCAAFNGNTSLGQGAM